MITDRSTLAADGRDDRTFEFLSIKQPSSNAPSARGKAILMHGITLLEYVTIPKLGIIRERTDFVISKNSEFRTSDRRERG